MYALVGDQLSPVERTRSLLSAAHSCCICGVSLAYADFAGLTFLHVDDPERVGSFGPVCDRCDSGMVNGLYANPTGRGILLGAARRWITAVAISDRARTSPTPILAASDFGNASLLSAFLAVGAYERLYSTAITLRRRIGVSQGPHAAAARLQLLSAVGLRAYYLSGNMAGITGALERELLLLDHSGEFATSRNAARLALSRLYRARKSIDLERRVLGDFEIHQASVEDLADWGFRQVAFERFLGSDYGRLTKLQYIDLEGSNALLLMARAGVLGALGRSASEEGIDRTSEQIRLAFRESWRAVHRRGMTMTALKLSNVYSSSGDGRNALMWWSIAHRIRYGGRLIEQTMKQADAHIARSVGPGELFDDVVVPQAIWMLGGQNGAT